MQYPRPVFPRRPEPPASRRSGRQGRPPPPRLDPAAGRRRQGVSPEAQGQGIALEMRPWMARAFWRSAPPMSYPLLCLADSLRVQMRQ